MSGEGKRAMPLSQDGPPERGSASGPWSSVNKVLDDLATGNPVASIQSDRDKYSKRRITSATKPGAFRSTASVGEPGLLATRPTSLKTKRSTIATAPGAFAAAESGDGRASMKSAPPFRKGKRTPDPTVSLAFAPLSTLEEPGVAMTLPTRPTSKPSLKMKRSFAPATVPGAVASTSEPQRLGAAMKPSAKGTFVKRKRSAPATVPGAVAASEPGEPGDTTTPIPTLFSSIPGKMKRSVAASVPGAVAASEPYEPGAAVAPVAVKPAVSSSVSGGSSGKMKRTVAASVPGAVAASEPYEPGAAVAPVAVKPAVSSSVSGGSSGKMKRTVAATVPGAVASSEPYEPGAEVAPVAVKPAVSSSVSGGSSGKMKRTVAATVPGAIAASEPLEPGTEPVSQNRPGSSEPVKIKRATPAAAPGAMPEANQPSEPGIDSAPVSSLSPTSRSQVKIKRVTPAMVPGVVAAVEEPEERAGRAAATPNISDKRDELAKSKSRRGGTRAGTAPGVTKMSGEEADAMDQAMRRKDPRAMARTARMKDSKMNPNESDDSRQKRLEQKLDAMENMERGRSARLSSEGATTAAIMTTDLGQTKEPPLQCGVVGGGHANGGDGTGGGQSGDGDLAVAVAVQEDDDEYDPFLSFAQEYDPDAKPPLYRNRRFRLYGILACITVVAAVIGAIVGVTLSDGKLLPPTLAPTTAEELEYRIQFAEQVSELVFEDGTSHDLAANWIMFEDPLNLPPDAPNLIQRYVMALFYYMTTSNRESRWRSCNPPMAGEETNCTFLILGTLDDGSIGYTEEDGWQRWLSGSHECDWAGLGCDTENTVRLIEIWGHNMTGTLPAELSSLPFLQWISLQENEFTGNLPWDALADLSELILLEMHFNMLTGSIPDSAWTQSTTLQTFNVAGNMMTGTISSLVGEMVDLKGLILFQNNFVGPIPTEIGKLRGLAFLRLEDNDFNGAIPTELGNLSLLQELYLQNNNGMSGTIPSEIGLLTRLDDLFLDNCGLGGTIPEQLYNIRSLERLYLFDQELTGTLSTSISQLRNLFDLRLRQNQLAGPIPSQLADIFGLRLAWLHLNLFTGSMPDEVCDVAGPGLLEFLNADCAPIGNSPNPCDCCSSCCNRITGICFLQDF